MPKKKSHSNSTATSHSLSNNIHDSLKKEIIDSILVEQRTGITEMKIELSETIKKEVEKETNIALVKRGFLISLGAGLLSMFFTFATIKYNSWISYHTVIINGKIQDDNGDGIANAIVVIQGSYPSTKTDEKGFYSIETQVPSKQDFVIISTGNDEYKYSSYLMERDISRSKMNYKFNLLLSDSEFNSNKYYDYSYFDY